MAGHLEISLYTIPRVEGRIFRMFYVYGDESIIKGVVVYGLVITPVDQLEVVEATIKKIKSNYRVSADAKFHCRRIFHPDSRRKSCWSHLDETQCHQMALDLTTALGGKGLMTTVGHLNASDAADTLPSVGNHAPLDIEDTKQLVPFAFLAAMGPLCFDPKFRNKMKLWIDPDSSMVKWWGGNRQSQRLLSVGELNFELLKRTNEVIPENVETKERPSMLEVADLLAYSSARVLTNQGRTYDHVFDEILRLMNPVKYPFKWMPQS